MDQILDFLGLKCQEPLFTTSNVAPKGSSASHSYGYDPVLKARRRNNKGSVLNCRLQ